MLHVELLMLDSIALGAPPRTAVRSAAENTKHCVSSACVIMKTLLQQIHSLSVDLKTL